MASLSRSGGRKKDDAVWQVFEYCADIGKSRCLVKNKNDKPCNEKLNGKNPTNLKVHYTPCISALVLSRLDYCSPCLLDYRGQQSHHCRASRKLQLDSSWICHHAIMSVRLRRSSIGCWCTTTSSSSWLCSCSKHALVSVLYIWETPWHWRVKTPVGTICALLTPPTTLFHEWVQSLGREHSVLLDQLFGTLLPSPRDQQTPFWVSNGSSKHTFLIYILTVFSLSLLFCAFTQTFVLPGRPGLMQAYH